MSHYSKDPKRQDTMHKLFRNAGRAASGAYWSVRKNKDTVFYTGMGLAAATELLTTGNVEPTKYVYMSIGRELTRNVAWLVTSQPLDTSTTVLAQDKHYFTAAANAVSNGLICFVTSSHGSLNFAVGHAAMAALSTIAIGGPDKILPTYRRMWNWEKHRGKPPRGGKKRLAEWLQNARDTLGRALPAPMPQPAYQPVNFMKTASAAPAAQVTMP